MENERKYHIAYRQYDTMKTIIYNNNLTLKKNLTKTQFMNWNIEWMNSLFEGDPPQFKARDTKVTGGQKKQNSRRQGTTGLKISPG
jgi:hypothetical protein